MSTQHYSEDDLTLYYYAEGRFKASRPDRMGRRRMVEAHLEECLTCAALYREISGTLALVGPPPVPERGEQYGLEVWQRIRHRLPEQEEPWLAQWFRWDRFALAGAALALVLAAFMAGRLWHQPAGTPMSSGAIAGPGTIARGPSGPGAPEAGGLGVPGGAGLGAPGGAGGGGAGGPAQSGASGNEVRQRILLTSVADHLDRSERVLTDIMNAPDHDDISPAQRWADDLLTTSRLYRQDAVEAGEQSVAGVLEELERSLLEIVHSPSKASAVDLEQLRRRIDAAALLFKVRVLSEELRRREQGAAERSLANTSTTKSS